MGAASRRASDRRRRSRLGNAAARLVHGLARGALARARGPARPRAHGASVVRAVAARRCRIRREQRADRARGRCGVGGSRLAAAASLGDRRRRAARRRESGRLRCVVELVPSVSCLVGRARLDRPCRARSRAGTARRSRSQARRRRRRGIVSSTRCIVRAPRRTRHGDRGDRGAGRDGRAARRSPRRRCGGSARRVRVGEATSRRRSARTRGRRHTEDRTPPRRHRTRRGRRARAWAAHVVGRRPKPRARSHDRRCARRVEPLPARIRRMQSSGVGSAAHSSTRRAPSRLPAHGSTRSCAASCVRSFRFKPLIDAV